MDLHIILHMVCICSMLFTSIKCIRKHLQWGRSQLASGWYRMKLFRIWRWAVFGGGLFSFHELNLMAQEKRLHPPHSGIHLLVKFSYFMIFQSWTGLLACQSFLSPNEPFYPPFKKTTPSKRFSGLSTLLTSPFFWRGGASTSHPNFSPSQPRPCFNTSGAMKPWNKSWMGLTSPNPWNTANMP